MRTAARFRSVPVVDSLSTATTPTHSGAFSSQGRCSQTDIGENDRHLWIMQHLDMRKKLPRLGYAEEHELATRDDLTHAERKRLLEVDLPMQADYTRQETSSPSTAPRSKPFP